MEGMTGGTDGRKKTYEYTVGSEGNENCREKEGNIEV